MIEGYSGRSEIVEQLRSEFEETCLGGFESEVKKLLTALTFHDDIHNLPCVGMYWEFLASILNLPQFAGRRGEFEEMLSKYLRKIMSQKIAYPRTKFTSQLSSPDQLSLNVSDDGAITLSNGKKDISYNFQAGGEQQALYFSTIAALRTMLAVDLPVVVNFHGGIESLLLRSRLRLICEMSEQVIILRIEPFDKDVEFTPTHRTFCDPTLGWGLTAF